MQLDYQISTSWNHINNFALFSGLYINIEKTIDFLKTGDISLLQLIQVISKNKENIESLGLENSTDLLIYVDSRNTPIYITESEFRILASTFSGYDICGKIWMRNKLRNLVDF